jgi:vacuolar-type H+-ATPase subunit B/Vma2
MAEIDCNIKKDWLVALQICVYAKSTRKTEVLAGVFDEMGIEFEELKYYL